MDATSRILITTDEDKLRPRPRPRPQPQPTPKLEDKMRPRPRPRPQPEPTPVLTTKVDSPSGESILPTLRNKVVFPLGKQPFPILEVGNGR
jgi:hypothetical protein